MASTGELAPPAYLSANIHTKALCVFVFSLTGSLWLKPFSRITSPCSPATSLYSSWATSASYAGSAKLWAKMFTKRSNSTRLKENQRLMFVNWTWTFTEVSQVQITFYQLRVHVCRWSLTSQDSSELSGRSSWNEYKLKDRKKDVIVWNVVHLHKRYEEKSS